MSNLKDKVELLSKLKKHTPIAKGQYSWVATLPTEMVGSVPSVSKYLGRALNIGARMNPYVAVGLGVADANKAMFGDESPFSGNYWTKPFSNGEIVPTFRGYPYQIDYENYSNPIEALAHGAYGTVNLPTVEVRPTMNAEEANPAETENNSSTGSGTSTGSSSATPNPDDNKEEKNQENKSPSVVERAKQTAENINKEIKEVPKKVTNGISKFKKGLGWTALGWQTIPPAYGAYRDQGENIESDSTEYSNKYLNNGFRITPIGITTRVLDSFIGYKNTSKDKQNSQGTSTTPSGGVDLSNL